MMKRIATLLLTLAAALWIGAGESRLWAGQPGLTYPDSTSDRTARPAEPTLRLAVRVYSLTPEALPHLPRALDEALMVLQDAGLQVRWLNCPAGREREPLCDQDPEEGEIRLRIVGDSRGGDNARSLGYALPLPNGGGVNATALFGALRRVRRGAPVSTAQLLGYVIAHEIGHLLLGVNSHSRRGLMAAPWNHEDLLRISQRQLHFTAQQGRRIRQAVQARMLAQAAMSEVDVAAEAE